MLIELGFTKTAKKEDRPSYGKELLGIGVGSTLGAIPGYATIGAGIGLSGGAQHPGPALALVPAGALAAILGGYIGGKKGLDMAYKNEGFKPPTTGQAMGRLGGASVSSSIIPVPIAGPAVGDYIVSRYLQDKPKKGK